MQQDPTYALRQGHHGSWVGAVETGDGEVVLLGSLGLDAHVSLDGDAISGAYETGRGRWFVARGHEKAVFSNYAAKLGELLGVAPKKAVPSAWCSWYGLYTAIDEQLLAQVAHNLGGLPFNVIQVDDGWQQAVGDWEANRKFPSGMNALADKIRATGRTAGLWLAPLVATRSSGLFQTRADWFLRDGAGRLVSAGFNWGEQVYALDTTREEVLEWLKALMQHVRQWGFDYIKLDFLYAGALPGKRLGGLPREAAYRGALHTLREGMGSDAFFVACGAPIIPSLGLCDALRVGPDVAANWETERDAVLLSNPAVPGTRNAIRTVLNRLWLKPLVQPDPDVAYFRSVDCMLTDKHKQLLQNLALICGFKATSDLPQWLSAEESERLRDFLLANPAIEQIGRARFRVGGETVDFTAAMDLPDAPTGWKRIQSNAIGWLASHEWALRLDHELGKRAIARKIKGLREGQ